jgi:hypothetical protein
MDRCTAETVIGKVYLWEEEKEGPWRKW